MSSKRPPSTALHGMSSQSIGLGKRSNATEDVRSVVCGAPATNPPSLH